MTDVTQRPARLPLVGDVLAGRYKLTRVIGEGGMGLIMGAQQLSMDREVAIKLVRPEALREESARLRFEREVHLAKELAHPHIVQLIDFGREGEVAWVAMELLEGEDLQGLIDREGPLDLGRSLNILEQVLDALTAAHRRTVVHRDLKPPNIFVTPGVRERDFVKVLDFGIARPVEGSAHFQTTTGYISGTLPYMAPEVLAENQISAAADVYAMGLVLLEMLYGRRIFDSDTPTKMALQHMRMQIPIAASLQASAIGPVIVKATAKRVEQRYADADEFLAAVVEARAQVDGSLVVSQDEISAAFKSVDRNLMDDLLPDSAPVVAGLVVDSLGPTAAAIPSQRQSQALAAPVTGEVAPASALPGGARILAAFVMVLIVATTGIVVFSGDTVEPPVVVPVVAPIAPIAVIAPEPDPKPRAAPAAVSVYVDSTPTGAEVWIAGERRYTTPVQVEVTEPVEWELRKGDLPPKSVIVGPDTQRLVVQLGIEEVRLEEPVTAKLTEPAKSDTKKSPRIEKKREPVEEPRKRAPGLVD